MKKMLMLAVTVMAASGCYHVTVVTGSPESANVIDRPWQLSLVSGLVPPPEIDASTQCQNGVAKVETKRSFLNSLVAALSSSLITPMAARVTCAGASPSPDGADSDAGSANEPATTGDTPEPRAETSSSPHPASGNGA